MKILYITTVGGTMVFFKKFIEKLIHDGHTVDIATCETEKSKVQECYRDWGCTVYQISTSRFPFKKGNIDAIRQIRNIVRDNGYELVHCHTPIAAACTRLACKPLRKKGVKVFYTAHGFHFYQGAPLKNWLIYYPVEKICAHWTDVLITINTEDYELAKKKLKAKRIEYVPGVGIDVSRFADAFVDKAAKRDEIGVPQDAFMLLSVGELNENKNHEVIIRAMAELNDSRVHYGIAGKGNLGDHLKTVANELGVSEHFHLLGYRKDIPELYKSADVCVFPSIREGLGLAAIEGMAAGLPLIVSNNRGSKAYAIDRVNAIVCPVGSDVLAYTDAIKTFVENNELCKVMGEYNRKAAWKYEVTEINEQMKRIYALN